MTVGNDTNSEAPIGCDHDDLSGSDDELDDAEPSWELGFRKASLAKPEEITRIDKAVCTVIHFLSVRQ